MDDRMAQSIRRSVMNHGSSFLLPSLLLLAGCDTGASRGLPSSSGASGWLSCSSIMDPLPEETKKPNKNKQLETEKGNENPSIA